MINFPQSWTCFPGMYMLMFLPQRRYHHNMRSWDGLTVLANWLEIVAILVHYQPFYSTSHTMKLSDPLLLADVILSFGMHPAGKVVLEYTLKCYQLISSSDNKKILFTTRYVRLDSGRYATKYIYSSLLVSQFYKKIHIYQNFATISVGLKCRSRTLACCCRLYTMQI